MLRVRCAGLTIALCSCVALSLAALLVRSPGGGASSPSVKASPTFCADAGELQTWIHQGEQPGLDQFDAHPGAADPSLRPDGDYLEKLAAEAPASEQVGLVEWAGFIGEVASGATSLMQSQFQEVGAIVKQVETWLTAASGCPRISLAQARASKAAPAPALSASSFESYLPWVVLGGFVVWVIFRFRRRSTEKDSDRV